MIKPDRTPVCAQGYLATLEWTVLPHFSYSLDLAPFNFHLLGRLKDELQGRRFAKDDELKHSVHEKFDASTKGFMRVAHSVSRIGGKSVDNEGTMEK
jgi:hypothetical protein